jgi:hypothetical protein
MPRNRPKQFLIRGQKVLDQISIAPEHIRVSFYTLLTELEHGPYPDQHPCVAGSRGIPGKHRYVAWNDTVEIMYMVTQDMPVLVLIGVHWKGDPGGGDGEDAPDLDWYLAA